MKSTDRILSDAETSSFVIGNEPDFFIASIFLLENDVEYHFVYFTDRSVNIADRSVNIADRSVGITDRSVDITDRSVNYTK